MGRLKLLDEKGVVKGPPPAPKKGDESIIDEHVQGFLANWDSKPHGVIPYSTPGEIAAYELGQRAAYATGVKDALLWVKRFNEENRGS